MLRLEAESRVVVVGNSSFSDLGSVKEVAGVELHARFGCEHFNESATLFIHSASGHVQWALSGAEHKRVIDVQLVRGYFWASVTD